MLHRWICLIGALLVLLLAGCNLPALDSQGVGGLFPNIITAVPTVYIAPATPFQPVPTDISTPTLAPTPTLTPPPDWSFWLEDSLPPALRKAVKIPAGAHPAQDAASARIQIGALRGGQVRVDWTYAVAAPFPTLLDDISLGDLQRIWRGEAQEIAPSLWMMPATRAALTAWWGPEAANAVMEFQDAETLLDRAWQETLGTSGGAPEDRQTVLAIIPFEDIEPRWKVIRVDGLSPLDNDFDAARYSLTLWFGVAGDDAALAQIDTWAQAGETILPVSNRDPHKLTVLTMTGVTALARATGARMEALGMTYPAQDIQDWLYNADLLHISNEVSFNPKCPPANPNNTSTMFCSRPEYIELLDSIGTDIVELSGNHNNDWGRKAFTYSLDLYAKRGWKLFAGGENLEAARQPAIVEHNGNRLAFLGCNPVGPEGVWATDTLPGVAPCDLDDMTSRVQALRAEGILPIVTFQYFERYVFQPSEAQIRDFRAMVDAGAVIVSGSQAHFPQYMEFYQGTMIHYGLGNLFFDQMDIPVVGTRREFIDRHVFYDGKYIGTELLTAMLEDYARPRPMTPEERRSLLYDIFTTAGW